MRLVGRRDLEASGGGRDLCGSAHREGAMIEPTPLPALPPPLGPPLWQGRSSVMQVWGSDLKWTPSTLLPKGNSAIQKMESFFSLKSIIATLLRSSSTSWLTDIILAFLCGLGLFLLLLPCLQSNPYLPPSTKHRNIRKVRNLCLNPNRDCLFFSYSYIHFLNHSERLLRWELSGKLEHHPSRDKPGQTMVRVGIRIYNPRSQARSPGMVESSRQVPMQWLMAKEWITKSSVSAGRLTPEHWFTSHLPIAGVEWDFPLCWDWSL